MALDSLLTKVVALPYSARFKVLREAGIHSRTKPEVAAILDAWERGDWQERCFCVQSCTGSGNTERLLRMIGDPSRTVANLALKTLAEFAGDDVLLEVLQNLSHRRRLSLMKRLRMKDRIQVIDLFLDLGFAKVIPRLAELLPYGSPSAVQRHHRKGEDNGGLLFWQRLARCHPKLAVQAILDKITEQEQPDALSLKYAQQVVQIAGSAVPDQIVGLVRRLAPFIPLAQLCLGRALFQCPNEFASIVLESDGSQPYSLLPIAHKLEPSIRLRILREQPNALPIQAGWFRKLSAPERSTIYQEVGRSLRDTEGFISSEILSLLPSQERLIEAERIALLPVMATRPQMQASYAAYLAWGKLRETTDRYLSHPEGEWRGWGWASLLTGLRYQRNETASVLAMIRKRKFEQDPVRLVILQNLNALPAGVWKEPHLIDLAGIVREALDATDLSSTSVMFLTAFIQKLIPNHVKWATQQLIIIYRERGNIGGYLLEPRTNDPQAILLEESFLDVGNEWGRGNRVGWLYWFASALGKRLRVCTRLLKVLERLLGNGSADYDAPIVALLGKHLPHCEFERLCQSLIAKHESWVAIPTIFLFLHRHRQDWLEPYLSKPKFRMKGGSTVELVSLLQTNGYQRYTLKQQNLLAKTLNDLIRLPVGDQLPNDVWTMLAALNILGLLPAVDPARLIDLSNDKRPVIAESAVRALGRLDSGQGLPILITALGDERARIAIYALRRAIRDLPANRVIAFLRNAPLKHVTVAKETIRLVGEFGGPAGFEWLISLASQNLHRDVRVAVLRGLWDHLEHPETWTVLTEAARSTDGQLLNGVVRIPADRLSEISRCQLIELLSGLATHPDAVIRLAVLQRFIDLPLPDSQGRLLQAALTSLTAASPDERELAARVIAANSSPLDAPKIASAVTQMMVNRRLLHDFVRVACGQALINAPIRRRLKAVARVCVEVLRQDRITAGLRLSLTAGILGVDAFEEELRFLVDSEIPVSAVLTEAMAAIEQFNETTNRKVLPQLEARLGASKNPYLRLLAFKALQVQAQDHNRWDEIRCNRLNSYRNDPSPLVAIRAQFFFDADPA